MSIFSSDGFDEYLKKTGSSRKAQRTYAQRLGQKPAVRLTDDAIRPRGSWVSNGILPTTNWAQRRRQADFEKRFSSDSHPLKK